MKKELAAAIRQPVLFLEDWPQPPKGSEEEYEKPGLNDVKKWRLQTLLAVNPWGIPSLAFSEAYKRMYGYELDLADLGFAHLFDMVSKLSDVFTIQEPDEITALMFPEYPQDRILHDARVGHSFDELFARELLDPNMTDPETLITYAWINRDGDFPPDVVLPGEKYSEVILLASANIPGTRGVHQAVLVGAASPEHLYINIKNGALSSVHQLTDDMTTFLEKCGLPMTMFIIPDEFIYQGFPCLVFFEQENCWERCEVIGRSPKGNKVLVETVDFGGTHKVDQHCLYLMPRKFFDFPKQGVLVSLMGIKNAEGSNRWPGNSGSRVRCFSNQHYYLDCLLLEPARSTSSTSSENSSVGLDSLGSSDDVRGQQFCRKIKRWQRKPQYEAIICDRNDDDMNIYIDQTLVLETYAISDENRFKEVEILRQQLEEALKSMPRPKNPFNAKVDSENKV